MVLCGDTMMPFILTVIFLSHWMTGAASFLLPPPFGSSTSITICKRRIAASSLKDIPGTGVESPPIEVTTTEGLSPSDAASDLSSKSRGKVNEIDFCIAPADVSLSRAYGTEKFASTTTTTTTTTSPTLSLTRALNNASNRAVRRILLARSWPSAEALNLSLRRAAAAEKERDMAAVVGPAAIVSTQEYESKCPVPRPILNVLTRKRRTLADGSSQPKPRGRTDEEYVADQLKSFRERYDSLPGYDYAEAYLASILSLATSGIESPRVNDVLASGVYDESYKRVLSVLRSVGVTFEKDKTTGRSKISSKLLDQDICLSVLDKIRMRQEGTTITPPPPKTIVADASTTSVEPSNGQGDDEPSSPKSKQQKRSFFGKDEKEKTNQTEIELTREDLGGVLLSAEEPSMTRQLNILSNIVLRALLFGGDQELLVLAETLDADRDAFVERWYPGTEHSSDFAKDKQERPGLQFLNCLIGLLRVCYDETVMSNLSPPLPLPLSFKNSYERLVATAVELGSGYIKPMANDVMSMPKPRSAKEELGRFAVWESNFRQASTPDPSSYPDDLEGVWEVRDEIGGETIGTATVVFRESGKVEVDPPLQGLRWRLDPGPTHLDTCTFQVLSSDGTILQYRGFIDRGARLESRFSKRPIRIRGSVMFQMRDGSIDYYKDMLPINYKTGTTKFVMTKKEIIR